MVVTQVISAAGVLLLGIVTLTGRITKSLREEMHDMNGRLGRIEGQMNISASNSLQGSQ